MCPSASVSRGGGRSVLVTSTHPVVSHDVQRVPPEYALQKINPTGHYQLAAAANESPGDYAVSLFRYSPQQARASEINALSYRDLQSQ